MENENINILHQVMAAQPSRASVLTVTSGKGGVGKTNVSANLAICFSAGGRKVLLIDADLGLGNLDIVMGIHSSSNLLDVINGSKSLSDVIHPGPGGVDVICGGSGIAELANINQFQRQRLVSDLSDLQDSYDLIVIDTAAGINSSVISFCSCSDHVLVVTSPEPAAMTDAYAVIKVLSREDYQGRMSVAVNMASSVSEGKGVYRQIADVATRFLGAMVYDAGVLCKSDKILSAVRKKRPAVLCYPSSRFTRSLAAMASRLLRGTTAVQQKEGFFQKVVNLFF